MDEALAILMAQGAVVRFLLFPNKFGFALCGKVSCAALCPSLVDSSGRDSTTFAKMVAVSGMVVRNLVALFRQAAEIFQASFFFLISTNFLTATSSIFHEMLDLPA